MAPLSNLDATVVLGAATLGLVSAFHCIGMCGPIMCSFQIKGGNLVGYHIGKFLSYLSLALILHFSTFSLLLNFSNEMKLYIFLLLIVTYAVIIASLFWKKEKQIGIREKLYQRIFRKVTRNRNPFLRAVGLGGLSGLLPCAILYSFLLSVAIVSRVEVLVLSVLFFATATAVGLSFFNILFNKINRRFPAYKRMITICFMAFSFLIMFHRYSNFSFEGLCSNGL